MSVGVGDPPTANPSSPTESSSAGWYLCVAVTGTFVSPCTRSGPLRAKTAVRIWARACLYP